MSEALIVPVKRTPHLSRMIPPKKSISSVNVDLSPRDIYVSIALDALCAGISQSGIIAVTLCTNNIHAAPAHAEALVCLYTVLTADDIHAHNTFEAPETVKPQSITVDVNAPFTLPHASVLALSIKL